MIKKVTTRWCKGSQRFGSNLQYNIAGIKVLDTLLQLKKKISYLGGSGVL
jgi:hypothetical protein